MREKWNKSANKNNVSGAWRINSNPSGVFSYNLFFVFKELNCKEKVWLPGVKNTLTEWDSLCPH